MLSGCDGRPLKLNMFEIFFGKINFKTVLKLKIKHRWRDLLIANIDKSRFNTYSLYPFASQKKRFLHDIFFFFF